jgi:hypothetical protein
LSASGVVDVQCHTASHARIFCATDVRDYVRPAYAATPLLNRPLLTPHPALRFLTPDDLGAPLYAARSRMSDARLATVSIEAHERCVAHVAREGGAAYFRRPDWRADLDGVAAGAPPDREAFETDGARRAAIEDELDRGRATLNERLGIRSVNHICLPWGVSSEDTAAALKRLGYRSAFANRMRGVHAVRPGDDPYWLKRLSNRHIFRLPGPGRRLWA